ncbi:hypothetical protein B0H13DRAFT_1930776 [Mycena leptocephala]|nr:hypothetical protein B0H13DRAFT_1930776 [Mycena leptocephala]
MFTGWRRGEGSGESKQGGKGSEGGRRIGTGTGWDAPTLARVGVDAGIARAAARRDSGSRQASAARRGYCELARIQRNSVSPDAELGVAVGALRWVHVDTAVGRAWGEMGGAVWTRRETGMGMRRQEGRGDAKTGRAESWEREKQHGGRGWGWRVREHVEADGTCVGVQAWAYTGVAAGEGDGGVEAGQAGLGGTGSGTSVPRQTGTWRGRSGMGEGEEMGVGTDGQKAQGGFRAGRGHSGEGRREGRAETEDTVVRRNGTGMGPD